MSGFGYKDAINEAIIRDRAQFDKLNRNSHEVIVLRALSNGEISVGKACEALRHWICDGKKDPLPENAGYEVI